MEIEECFEVDGIGRLSIERARLQDSEKKWHRGWKVEIAYEDSNELSDSTKVKLDDAIDEAMDIAVDKLLDAAKERVSYLEGIPTAAERNGGRIDL